MTLPSIIHREPQPCIILDLRCTNCGPVRMAIEPEDTPPAEMPCPYCDSPAPATTLGTGHTRRILPYFDLAPNLQALDSIQIVSGNMRPLVRGQLVCYCEEPTIAHFAKVEDVFTSRAHLSASGLPSVSFSIAGDRTEPVPHLTGAETYPWWCFADELPRGKTEAVPAKSGQCAKGKHPLCKAKVCGCECHSAKEGATNG